MSAHAAAWALEQSAPSGIAKLVLIVIANFADAQNVSRVSRLSLRSMAQISERCLRDHLNELESVGLIVKIKRRADDGLVLPDEYFIPKAPVVVVDPPAKSAYGRPPANPAHGCHKPKKAPQKQPSIHGQDLPVDVKTVPSSSPSSSPPTPPLITTPSSTSDLMATAPARASDSATKRVKRRHPFPADWTPRAEERDLATRLGFTTEEFEHATAEFIDFWRSRNGRVSDAETANWHLAFAGRIRTLEAAWKTSRRVARSPQAMGHARGGGGLAGAALRYQARRGGAMDGDAGDGCGDLFDSIFDLGGDDDPGV